MCLCFIQGSLDWSGGYLSIPSDRAVKGSTGDRVVIPSAGSQLFAIISQVTTNGLEAAEAEAVAKKTLDWRSDALLHCLAAAQHGALQSNCTS